MSGWVVGELEKRVGDGGVAAEETTVAFESVALTRLCEFCLKKLDFVEKL